jgi:hypothetical protein
MMALQVPSFAAIVFGIAGDAIGLDDSLFWPQADAGRPLEA